MSYTNKTQHYELPQWTGEDKPTFLVDMNNAFAKIDEELYNAGANSDSAQQSAQGATQLAQSVNQSLGETNAEVQRINGEVVLLKGTTTTLDNRVKELEGGSGSVSEQLTAMSSKVNGNTSAINDNKTDIASLQGDMVVAKTDIDTLEGQLSSGATKFQFGVDENGNYGYIKAGADTVTPFSYGVVTHLGKFNFNNNSQRTLNISEMFPNEFKNFTIDNFLIVINNFTAGSSNGISGSGASLSKSYNNITGILSYAGSGAVKDYYLVATNFDIYLVKGEIKELES